MLGARTSTTFCRYAALWSAPAESRTSGMATALWLAKAGGACEVPDGFDPKRRRRCALSPHSMDTARSATSAELRLGKRSASTISNRDGRQEAACAGRGTQRGPQAVRGQRSAASRPSTTGRPQPGLDTFAMGELLDRRLLAPSAARDARVGVLVRYFLASREEYGGAGIPACESDLDWQAGMPAPVSGCGQRLPCGNTRLAPPFRTSRSLRR